MKKKDSRKMCHYTYTFVSLIPLDDHEKTADQTSTTVREMAVWCDCTNNLDCGCGQAKLCSIFQSIHLYCWCTWSTGAAFCQNQSAGCAST